MSGLPDWKSESELERCSAGKLTANLWEHEGKHILWMEQQREATKAAQTGLRDIRDNWCWKVFAKEIGASWWVRI